MHGSSQLNMHHDLHWVVCCLGFTDDVDLLVKMLSVLLLDLEIMTRKLRHLNYLSAGTKPECKSWTLPCRQIITFCVSRRRRKMYCGHARLCVCVCVCMSVRGHTPTLLHGPGCNLGRGRRCPLVVHYWADLQSGHGLHCYGNTAWTLVTSLLWQYAHKLIVLCTANACSVECEMSASACTCAMAGRCCCWVHLRAVCYFGDLMLHSTPNYSHVEVSFFRFSFIEQNLGRRCTRWRQWSMWWVAVLPPYSSVSTVGPCIWWRSLLPPLTSCAADASSCLAVLCEPVLTWTTAERSWLAWHHYW